MQTILKWLFLASLLFTLNLNILFAETNRFAVSAQLGVNISHPIILKNGLSLDYDQSYVPGYNSIGWLRYNYKSISFGTGFGFKHINFNLSYGKEHEDVVRLPYISFPFGFSFYFNQSRQFFISTNVEFTRLINDVNFEIYRHTPYSQFSIELYNWYKKWVNWLYLGFGMRLHSNSYLLFEIGSSTQIQTLPKSLPEGLFATGDFLRHEKRIITINVSLIYPIMDF